MNALLSDLRQTIRSLGRQPGFTALVVGTLALGIGSCVVIFSVVYALLLKPLPYADPARLLRVGSVPLGGNAAGVEPTGLAPVTVADLQAALPAGFTGFAGATYNFVNVTRVPTPTQLTVSEVTPRYFALLGVRARLGRTLGPEDCRVSAPATVVLGDAVWRQQFAADPEVIGRTITLNDLPRTVVGVMGPGFKEPQNVAELWLPLPVDEPAMLNRAGRSMNALARLAPGARPATANAALAAAAADFARTYPAENGGWGLVAEPLAETLVSDLRAGLTLLLGAVGGMLLVTCGALVVVEIAVTLVLLAAAGLLGRSFLGLLRTSPGLRTERVLSLGISLSESRYPDAPRRAEFYRQVLEQTGAVPGVAGVAMASTTPFNWSLTFPFLLDGQTAADPGAARQSACYDAVNPDYFATLDVPLRAGRSIAAGDTADTLPVAVVSEGFVRRFLPVGRDPLGQRITFPNARVPLALTIVGVAADVRRSGLDKEAPAQVYVSYRQRPTTFATLFVRAAGTGAAEALTRPVQEAVWALNPDQPITSVSTLSAAVRNSVGPTRLYLALFGGFSALALGLAALGIYGTVTHAVGQRTREIGIRVALGATARDVLRLVLGQGAWLVGGGLVAGLAVALGVTRLLGSLLYGVGAGDPWTLGGVAALLGMVALLACWLPARRAMRIDPVEALRQE